MKKLTAILSATGTLAVAVLSYTANAVARPDLEPSPWVYVLGGFAILAFLGASSAAFNAGLEKSANYKRAKSAAVVGVTLLLCAASAHAAPAKEWQLPWVDQEQQAPIEPLALPAAVAFTAIVVSGTIYASVKIYGWAKSKLYPQPKVPTNAPAGGGSVSGSAQSGSAAAMPDLLADPSCVFLATDAGQMPDGEECSAYAATTLQSSTDLKRWADEGPVEVWLSPGMSVLRFQGAVGYGSGTADPRASAEVAGSFGGNLFRTSNP